MKLIYTFIIITFLSGTLTAQKLFLGSDVSLNSMATISSTTNKMNFSPGIFQLSSNIEILWDSKKTKFTQQGLKIPLSIAAPTIDGQRYMTGKIGLLYSYNFGLDYTEDGSEKIGMAAYVGPHIGFSDRIVLDQPNTKVVPAIGLSAGIGLTFKMFNNVRARIMYNFSYDVLEFRALRAANDSRQFVSHGFSIGFSKPFSNINGKTLSDRRKLLRIK